MSSGHKYHAQKVVIDGHTFPSKKEGSRYQELCLLQRAGAITDLKIQVPFTLIDKSEYGREIKYVADFVYYEDGWMVVEDTKGFRTPTYKLKARLFAERYHLKIKET